MGASRFEQYQGADNSQLSLLHLQDGDDMGGGDMSLLDGYGTLIASLAAFIEIRLNQVVTHIDWIDSATPLSSSSSSSSSSTRSSSGGNVAVVRTAGGVIYRARRVIITLPLGVLKKQCVVFNPPLPVLKQAAITAMGVSCMNKVFMLFPTQFWQHDISLIGIASEEKGKYPWYLLFTRHPSI